VSGWVLIVSTDGDTTASLGNLFDHPQREEVFSCVQMAFQVLQFVSTAACPVSGHHRDKSISLFFIPSCQVFIHAAKIPQDMRVLLWKGFRGEIAE